MQNYATKVHELKTWPEFFEDMASGSKNFELRKNDRNFQVGDILCLREYNPETKQYTGRLAYAKIHYILTGGQFGLEEGYVIMNIQAAHYPAAILFHQEAAKD